MKIVLSSASHHAMMFAFFAKVMIDQFGETGQTVITEAVRTYGFERGKRMAKRAVADGNPLDALSYIIYQEWEAFPGQVEKEADLVSGNIRLKYFRCPWNTEWTRRGMLKYGAYYCNDIDQYLAKGFGNIDLNVEMTMVTDQEHCSILLAGHDVSEEQIAELQQREEKIKDKAVRPWEYHVAHLYASMRNTIVLRLGEDGEKAVGQAMSLYEEEYGSKALKLVYDYANRGFD